MGSLESRLQRLERVLGCQDQDAKAFGQFLRCLSDEQLRWLLEPLDEGQGRVPCPHVESLKCECRSDGRRRRAMEAFPELVEEYLRRRGVLYEEVRRLEHWEAYPAT
jgi:hypothetical protein